MINIVRSVQEYYVIRQWCVFLPSFETSIVVHLMILREGVCSSSLCPVWRVWIIFYCYLQHWCFLSVPVMIGYCLLNAPEKSHCTLAPAYPFMRKKGHALHCQPGKEITLCDIGNLEIIFRPVSCYLISVSLALCKNMFGDMSCNYSWRRCSSMLLYPLSSWRVRTHNHGHRADVTDGFLQFTFSRISQIPIYQSTWKERSVF